VGIDAVSTGAKVFIQMPLIMVFTQTTPNNKTNKADVTVNSEEFGQSALIGSAKYQYNTSVYYKGDAFNICASYKRRVKFI